MQDLKPMVRVRVPATTANFGWCYDSIGATVDRWLTVIAEPQCSSFGISISGEGHEYVEHSRDNLIVRCCVIAWRHCEVPEEPLISTIHFTIYSDVPFGCGLGSSSAAAVAGYVVGRRLLSLEDLTSFQLLQRVAEIEGHADNAAPAIYGGVQLVLGRESSAASPMEAAHSGDGALEAGVGMRTVTNKTIYEAIAVSMPHGSIPCVLFVPHEKMKPDTNAMRALVPTQVPLADAIHSLSRSALLVLAIEQGKLNSLRNYEGERLHQDRRSDAFYPHARAGIRAALKAGAAHAFISGAGPSLCALVAPSQNEKQVEELCAAIGKGMVDAAESVGVKGRVFRTCLSQQGVN